ncbi:Fur-regulated basic protein FbpA [Neobacillus sp. K501]
MTNQLRKGVETLKLFYINRLMESGEFNASKHQLHSLTLSELETIFNKLFPSNTSSIVHKSNQCKEI